MCKGWNETRQKIAKPKLNAITKKYQENLEERLTNREIPEETQRSLEKEWNELKVSKKESSQMIVGQV